jgi:hypothetical protein
VAAPGALGTARDGLHRSESSTATARAGRRLRIPGSGPGTAQLVDPRGALVGAVRSASSPTPSRRPSTSGAAGAGRSATEEQTDVMSMSFGAGETLWTLRSGDAGNGSPTRRQRLLRDELLPIAVPVDTHDMTTAALSTRRPPPPARRPPWPHGRHRRPTPRLSPPRRRPRPGRDRRRCRHARGLDHRRPPPHSRARRPTPPSRTSPARPGRPCRADRRSPSA